MDKLIASRIAGGNTAYKRNDSDFYPTPPEATQALMDYLNLPPGTRVWEPACGEGHMVDVLVKNGCLVSATDIQMGHDFLTMEPDQIHFDWIITNPPFSLAERFIERCAALGKPFALLLKSQYWHAKSRYELFHRARPSAVLPLTWRPDFLFKTRGSGSPLMDVIWVIWEPGAEITVYQPLDRPTLSEGDHYRTGRNQLEVL